MGLKEKCKDFMTKCFGPATANMVDAMDESNCVEQCKNKIRGFLGEDKVAEFEQFVNS